MHNIIAMHDNSSRLMGIVDRSDPFYQKRREHVKEILGIIKKKLRN